MKARHRPTELMKYQCEFCTKGTFVYLLVDQQEFAGLSV